MDLDQTDKAILAYLMDHRSATFDQLEAALGVPVGELWHRLFALKVRGCVAQFEVDWEATVGGVRALDPTPEQVIRWVWGPRS